jgi:hypothetical protein
MEMFLSEDRTFIQPIETKRYDWPGREPSRAFFVKPAPKNAEEHGVEGGCSTP